MSNGSEHQALSVMTVAAIALAVILGASISLYILQTSLPTQTVKPTSPERQISKQEPPKGSKDLPPPRTIMIKAVSKTEFKPSFVDISVGSTIIWENVDGEAHTATSNNVTAGGSPFYHSLLNPGDRFEFKFEKPGTYYFQCVIAFHEMSGIVTVRG